MDHDQEKFYTDEEQAPREEDQPKDREVNDMTYFIELMKHLRTLIERGSKVDVYKRQTPRRSSRWRASGLPAGWTRWRSTERVGFQKENGGFAGLLLHFASTVFPAIKNRFVCKIGAD